MLYFFSWKHNWFIEEHHPLCCAVWPDLWLPGLVTTGQLHMDDWLLSTWGLSALKSMCETSSNQEKKNNFWKCFHFYQESVQLPWCFVIKHSKQHFLLQVYHLFLNFACMANFCLCISTQGCPVDIGWECTRLGAIRRKSGQREAVQAVLPPVIWYGVV